MTKKYFTLVLVSLLSLSAFASQYQGMITLTLNGELRVMCTFDDEAETVTLGNGYNACISHYLEGELTIPGTYTNGSTTWKVVVAPMAFRFCTGLTTVIIEEGVEHIGDCAFVGCSGLTHITLPSTLQTVGSGAFSELASLRVVKCMATTAPTWQWNDVFAALGTKKSMENMASKRILYIPSGSTDSYLNTKFDGTSTGTQTTANEKVGWQEAFSRIYELTTEPQTISTLAELEEFRDAVNNGRQYKHSQNNSVVLTADIDMTSVSNWTPIGTAYEPFNGVFDGGGHTIKGLCVNNSPGTDYVGLFGYAKNATIYNLHLYNPTVKGKNNVGTLLGYVYQDVRISDVLVTGSNDDDYTVYGDDLNCGGIVGRVDYKCSIERCMFRGVIRGAVLRCGGILGYGYNDVAISDCSTSHYIQTNQTDGGSLGGIVGEAAQATIERCLARNRMDASTSINTKLGYVLGEVENDIQFQRTISINNCAYWGYSSDISTVGAITENQYTTLTQSGYQAFGTEAEMTGKAAKAKLGDGWHYFTGLYTDYPIPATLLDMYMNHLVYGTNSDGLVFAPIGNLNDFTQYQVVGYTGTAKSVTIPAEFNGMPVAAIGQRAFYGSDITAIDLGNTVTTVKAQAFWNCDNLTSFTIGRKFKNHDGNFLAYCHKLQSLTVGPDGNDNNYLCQDNVLIHNTNNTTYIVACAAGKTGHYDIPYFSGYDYIHLLDNCFGGCTGLTSITFPDCGCYLPNGVFNGLTNLHYIDSYLATTCNADHTDKVYYTVSRRSQDNPFYGTSKATIIYLKAGHGSAPREYNVVIAGSAYRLQITDGWDFYPPTDITSEQGVHFDRKLQATRTEITRPTGNKITLKDENDQDVEVDELEVTGYTYTPRGYSVFLPYALTLTAENAKVFVPSAITDGDDWRVTFTEVTNKQMEAYTPYYIVVSGEEEVSLSTSGRTTIGSHFTTVNTQTVGTGFDFSTGTLTLDFVEANEIEAGVPYIVKWSRPDGYDGHESDYDIHDPVFTSVTVATDTPADHAITSQDGKVSFTGTYNAINYTADNKSILLLGNGNTLYYPLSGASIGACRAYFQLNGISASEVTAARLNFDDEEGDVLGITTTDYTDSTDKAGAWYTLDGMRLDEKPTKKGLYIHGRRLVSIPTATARK